MRGTLRERERVKVGRIMSPVACNAPPRLITQEEKVVLLVETCIMPGIVLKPLQEFGRM
jgi:hypothetical protein